MGSFNNSILLNALLFFFFYYYFSNTLFRLAKSDDKLMDTLCSKTEEPVICKDCLHADPKSSSADGKGLALVALDCAEKDTTHLHEDTFELLQNATGKMKEALDECAAHSFLAQQVFSPVKGYVQQGDYRGARDVITGEIIPYVASCLKAFDQVPDLPVPQAVLTGTVAANQTSKNAASILGNI